MITAAILAGLGCPAKNQAAYAAALEDARIYGAIDTRLKCAHFLGQIATETGRFSALEENLHYSAKRLTQVWPKRFPTIASALPYAWDPSDPDREDVALADLVYGGRGGNQLNGTDDDDGWKYRGRGFLQITFLANYQEFERETGFHVVADPDLLIDPVIAAKAAAVYWMAKGCNLAASRGDVEAVTKLINGGLNGLDTRKAFTAEARRLLGA